MYFLKKVAFIFSYPIITLSLYDPWTRIISPNAYAVFEPLACSHSFAAFRLSDDGMNTIDSKRGFFVSFSIALKVSTNSITRTKNFQREKGQM